MTGSHGMDNPRRSSMRRGSLKDDLEVLRAAAANSAITEEDEDKV